MSSEPKFIFKGEADLTSLWEIIKALRGEKGCPWDKKQTPETLKKYLLEETYELLSAISDGHKEELKEEFGDLLFIVLFLLYIYQEKNIFTLKEVVYLTYQKMIRRHPHVFGEAIASSAEEVLSQWQKIKKEEGKGSSILGNIPKIMPALQRAYRLGERAARINFDWPSPKEVVEKLKEELSELESALTLEESKENLELEIGDLLFTVANLSRKLEINPEEALHKALDKFEKRFKDMEELLKKDGLSLGELPMEVLDRYWEKIKENEKNS